MNGHIIHTSPTDCLVFIACLLQLAMFDVVLAGQKSSVLGTAYRVVHRVKPIASASTTPTHTMELGRPGGLGPSPSPRLQARLQQSARVIPDSAYSGSVTRMGSTGNSNTSQQRNPATASFASSSGVHSSGSPIVGSNRWGRGDLTTHGPFYA